MLFSSTLTQLSGFKVIVQDLQASNYVIVDSAFPKRHTLVLRFVLVCTWNKNGTYLLPLNILFKASLDII